MATKPATETPSEDWWAAKNEARLPTATQPVQVLKLKGSPPQTQAEPALPAEEWEAAKTRREPPAKVESGQRKVLKLKASVQEEGEKEPASSAQSNSPAQTEDWWGETDASE
ncbi:MAG: hypothetical protein HYR94_25455 [Chloroflexi bacterium]|nr:hypothetical protein [Chloroflexota bacterium]